MINPYEYRKKAQLAIGGVDYNVQPLINNNNGNTVQQQASNEEQNWFVRGLSTIGNLAKNVLEGAIKSIEGIVDAGAMLVGLFGADVDNFVNYDFTADLFGTDEEGEGLLEWSWGRALEKASYLDDDNFINQVANGVGGMLPTVLLAVASGGSSIAGTTAAKALSAASKVGFVAGAAGNASEEAFKQGANYGQALGYGALSGAIEAGTEYIGGRVMGETTDLSKTLLGKLAIKTGTDKAISTGVGKAAYTFVSEGMEEVLSDLLNPVAKRITGVDKEATVDWGELPKTFLVGGATASVLNGIQNGASALKNSERGGKHYVRVAEEMQTIENTIGAQATLQSKKGISQEKYDAIGTRANERTLRSLENMSSEFKKMTAEERSNALKTIAESSPMIASVFEASGDIKTSIRESIQESISNKVVGNASADLVLRGDEVKATLEEVNKENGYNLEVDNDALTEVERGNYAKEIKAIQNIGNLSDSKLSLVIVKNNNNVNSFLEKRGNVIYASRETLSNGTWANKLAHEVTHFAEDSKEFKSFVDFVLEDQKAVKEAINDIIKASYGITENELTRTISKLASDKKLTKKENLAYSELIAHISEKLFTDEKSIGRLARSDKGLFNKIKNRISDMVENLKDTNAKETVSKLRKAEQLFNNALKSIAKEKEEFVRNLRKTTNEYKRDKKIYNMLEEDERASWLEEHGYVAEDFNDDILDNGEQQEENSRVVLTPNVAFSKKSFSQQVDEVISGTYESYSHLQVRDNTPKILQDIGLDNKPMLITAVHTKTAIGQNVAQKNTHHLSIETLKDLPQLLEKPAIVMESTKEGSVVAFVNAVDNENNPVICSILLEGKGQYNNIVIDTNLITSIYGKDTNPVGFVQKAIDENRVLFWDKKISQELSVKTGLQLSNLMANLDSNTIIRQINKKSTQNEENIKFSLKDNVENSVKEKYGDTYRWKEVGYILTDGTRLDLSGRNEGAPGGYRSIDHREIFEDMVIDDEDYATSENMIEFMGRGNIRVIPEYPGINLQVEPNEAQYKRIGELVESLGWKEGTFIVDFDNSNGEVKDTIEYDGKMSWRKVVDDIKYYFKEGKKPYQSDLSKFRFSLKDSKGNKLSQEQERFFRNSKVRDSKGNLQVVYHGTEGDFYVYDKSLMGQSTGTADAKLGFFFTNNKEVALSYAVNAYDNKLLSLQHKIANGDKNILKKLSVVEGYKELAMTEDIKEYAELEAKGENFNHDIKEQYLNIKNPLETDWEGKIYKKTAMLKVITKALTSGNDGVIIRNIEDSYDNDIGVSDVYVVFEPNQIKNTDNKNPTLTEDIRFSRKPANDIKAKANLVYDNVYTKKETRQFIEDILSQTESDIDELTYGEFTASLKGKTNIIEHFFEKLNSAEGKSKTKIAREMTDYIIDSISLEEVAQSEVAKESLDELKVLRGYRNKIDVSGYGKEINTVKGNNSLILQWGKKGGMEIYDVVRNLQERGHFTQVNLQDSFNDFDLFEEFTDYYGKLVEDVRNASKVALSSVLSEDKLSTLKENMTKNLLEMVREGGELSTLGKLKENFSNSIKTLKQQFAKNTNYWKAKATYQGDIWRTVADLRGYTEKGKIEKLGSATVLKDPYFKKMLEDMGKITWGGRIDPAKARACMEGLKQFFNKDNKLLQDYFEATYGETLTVGDISQATAEIEGTSNSMFNHLLDQFAELELAKKEDGTYRTNYLTTEELKATSTILKMCKHFLLHYDAIYEDGKRIEQKQAATKYYQLAEKSLNTHTVHKSNLIGWVSDKLFDYNAMIMSPKFVCEMLDGYYEDGFNSHYQQRFWRDSLQMEYDRMYLLENSDKFFKENKDYKKRLFDKNIQVKIGDYSLTIAEAVDLYLMSTQDNGLLTLTEGAGFVFDNERGGVTQCGTVTQEQINSMYEQFTAEDKEYIKILKDIYKKGGVEFKKPTDISRMGFSNIIDGEYYTLTRWEEAIAKSTSDIRSAIKDIQIANNLSYNKSRLQNAKKIPLFIGDSYQKMIRYVNAITLYKNFSEDLANFDKLFTKNISDTASPKTIKMIMDGKVWNKTSRYWGDLLADVQGVGMTQDMVSSWIGSSFERLRSNYAKAQLGFNLKVCMSQFASYPTAFIKLDAGVLTRALGHTVNYDDMDKYSQAATTRNYNKAIVKAEGVIDKVSSIGNVLTKGIQWSDRKTIGRLWVASQLQIEKTEGLKFGSIENMKKAGLLLDEVITETQPTYMAIDRSALQRSKNTLAKTISMFTSVPMKQVSNLIGSIAKLKAYKTRIRNGESINTQELNQAKKGVARAVGANVAANLMYAMICQLIKHIYNKDDEEENNGETIPEQILSQFFDTSISMFPIFSDIYEGLAKGYEIDVYETSAINDFIASIKSVVDSAGKVANGEADTQDIMNSLKKSLFAGGLLVGVPVRNMYNTIYGFTKRISPSTAYKINSLFVEPKSSDLKTALNKGDMELASVILTSLMGKKGFTVSEQQASTLAELYGQGYSLPSAIPNKITINGEEVELTVKQQGEFGQVYSRASSIADKILSDGSLNGKSNEVKAKTISYIYKYYYYEAQAKSLNIEVDSKLYMFGQLIDIQKLAMIISEVPILVEGLSNKKVLIQRYLQKQKLSAAQKYILMGYFGYSNKSGQGLVKALINRTNLSKEQKETLLEKCGY